MWSAIFCNKTNCAVFWGFYRKLLPISSLDPSKHVFYGYCHRISFKSRRERLRPPQYVYGTTFKTPKIAFFTFFLAKNCFTKKKVACLDFASTAVMTSSCRYTLVFPKFLANFENIRRATTFINKTG